MSSSLDGVNLVKKAIMYLYSVVFKDLWLEDKDKDLS